MYQKTDQLLCAPFLEHMAQRVELDDEVICLVAANCKLVQFDKDEKLLLAGDVSKFVYFIVSGKCVSYFTDFKGKTITWFFHYNTPESLVKNLFIVDYKSFLTNEKATLSIETLTPVTAIRFSAQQNKTLIESSRVFERWMRILNEKAFIQTYDRISSLLTLSATERYKKFLNDESWLVNMFSHHLISSYLDVAPQSLSRIKKNLGK
jgi:CRP-like cAMP-binding protein